MTVADDNTEFGRLYYAPVEEEHIVEFEEEGVGIQQGSTPLLRGNQRQLKPL